MSEKIKAFIVIFIGCVLMFSFTPTGKSVWNGYVFQLKKADNSTNYDTLKKVEDTCRAMVASYESDKLTYEQYKDSENEEKETWAEEAKMRANKTASTYNNYILENSFIWKDDVPKDILTELPYIY